MTFNLGWSTDIHLNFCHIERIKAYCERANKLNLDALVITGDISEGDKIRDHIWLLERYLKMPTFFVLGNHDFYNDGIVPVRERMKEHFTNAYAPGAQLSEPSCFWLGAQDFIELDDNTALIGHDGWYDGGYADWFKSQVVLADYHVIKDLIPLYENQLHQKLQDLSLESANFIAKNLPLAFAEHDHVFLATHVPPWAQNAVYEGKISDDQWLPHFSSKFMGDTITKIMSQYSNKKLTVLCGHSHGKAKYVPMANIEAYTGHAVYRKPNINKVFSW